MQNERFYKCTNITTVDGAKYDQCFVSVPSIDLSEAVDRQENLAAVSGALESAIAVALDVITYEFQKFGWAIIFGGGKNVWSGLEGKMQQCSLRRRALMD